MPDCAHDRRRRVGPLSCNKFNTPCAANQRNIDLDIPKRLLAMKDAEFVEATQAAS